MFQRTDRFEAFHGVDEQRVERDVATLLQRADLTLYCSRTLQASERARRALFVDHGVDYRTRRARSREHVLAMQSLWTEEVGGFDGEYVKIAPSWSWPKPDVEVPVLVGGGAGPKLFSHIAEYGHGWIPIGGAGLTDDTDAAQWIT